MSNVIYQPAAGRLAVNSVNIPLSSCVMSYRQNPVTEEYQISIRSTHGTHTWLSDQPLSTIETNTNATYVNLAAWISWWNNLNYSDTSA